MRLATSIALVLILCTVSALGQVDPRDFIAADGCNSSNVGEVCTYEDSVPPGGDFDCSGLGNCTAVSYGNGYDCQGGYTNSDAYCWTGSACGQCDPGWCNSARVGSQPGGEEACYDLNSTAPVELLSIAARANDDKIDIEWQTATELNNAGFWIELSLDGAAFSKSTFVEGSGTSIIERSYRTTVEPLGLGKNYVRLQQIDFDGTTTYLPVVEVDLAVPNGFVLNGAYPNPFNPATTITFTVAEEMDVTLSLLDMSGRMLETIYSGKVSPDKQQSVRFINADLPSGTYFYRLSTPAGSRIRSLTIIR